MKAGYYVPPFSKEVSMKKLHSLPLRSTVISILFCAALAIAASAQGFTSLADFNGSDAALPKFNGLVQGTDGNFYGVAFDGGTANGGSVYKVTPDGTVSLVYSFCTLAQCADGFQPEGSLLLGADGNFYGTTGSGGATNFGTVFKLASSGTLTTLYSFCPRSGCFDGSLPIGSLVQGFDGSFYGVTSGGGAPGRGTIFKITPDGTLTTVHTFCSLTNCVDGNGPFSLVLARDGSMYGITVAGGTQEDGTVFRFTPAGQFQTLYSFCSLTDCADGSTPIGSLVVTATGMVFGATEGGGAGLDGGTLFELSPSGTLTTLYSFCLAETCLEGAFPETGLIQATDGRLYGGADEGGFNNRGTVFRITTAGALIRLHSFDASDGAFPLSPLLQGTDGKIYGTTAQGGPQNRTACPEGGPPYGCGTIFRESLGMKPFVKSVFRAGHVGDSIIILGNNLTGSTSVIFNGIAATFSIVSDTEITATVPTGAATGLIQVVTPSTTLASNLVFRVLP
jgi:uncharacterized repeat protein (TIGR03803 family)